MIFAFTNEPISPIIHMQLGTKCVTHESEADTFAAALMYSLTSPIDLLPLLLLLQREKKKKNEIIFFYFWCADESRQVGPFGRRVFVCCNFFVVGDFDFFLLLSACQHSGSWQ